jgi:RNA polymerase sigma factor (sigma-70 family)
MSELWPRGCFIYEANTTADSEDLRRFRQSRDSEAFTELVQRYIDLVWAAGFRTTGDADRARDVAQTVFSDLARKADRLPKNTFLAGWLHRAATFAACRAVRDETRRRHRERQFMEMHALQTNSDEEDFERWLPFLDEAVAKLKQRDREAVLLRYFSQKSLAEIGAALGISEDAAQKRLARALDRLRAHFRRRGWEASAACLAGMLAAAGTQGAPPGVAGVVAAGSVAAAAAGATSLGSSLAGLISSLTPMKTPILATALVAVTATAPLLYQQYQLSALAQETPPLQAQAAELDSWRAAHAQARARPRAARELEQLRRNHDELLKLQAEAATLQTGLAEKLPWQQRLETAEAALAAAQAGALATQDRIQAQDLRLQRVDDLKLLGLAARLWATDNHDSFPPTFESMTNELAKGPDLQHFVEPYEFMRHEKPIVITEPQMILFREKQPRHLPSGNWERLYTLADGSVQRTTSDTDDFSEFESQHTTRRADGATAGPAE